MTGRSHGLSFSVIVGAGLAAVLMALQPHPSAGLGEPNHRDRCKPISDSEIETTAAQTTPSLTNFPVVVHYMKHDSEPAGQEPEIARARLFSLGTVKTFFSANGTFNRVWGQKNPKIQFVLVGVETCTYNLRLFPELARFAEESTVPNPDSLGKIEGLRFFSRVGRGYNVSTVTLANGSKPFRGLDLYLWPKIDNASGYARSSSATKFPAAWLGPDCKLDSSCDAMFAHEVAHFFGLCHVCSNDPANDPALGPVTAAASQANPRTCKQTCPLSAKPDIPLRPCKKDGNDDLRKALMADLGGTDLQDCEVSFVVSSAAARLTSADP